MPRIKSPEELENVRQDILSWRDPNKSCISICAGTGCLALGAGEVIAAFQSEIEKQGLHAEVDTRSAGCPGLCERGPLVVIYPEEICYVEVSPEDVEEIVSQTVVGKKAVERLLYTDPNTDEQIVHVYEIPFFKNQKRLLIDDNMKIDPRNIEDYLAIGGYSALAKVLNTMSPEEVTEETIQSGLRGRSGSGFPAGKKWKFCRGSEADIRYVICNCHEGDPGAFADRRVIEANPHNVLEGMIIGAYAIGASEAYVFVGDEFPQTVENIYKAIEQAEEYGFVGENILGSGFDLTLKVSIDGGGYVLGESTALMASMEGKVGEPRTKYDHATDKGFWAKPTVLNNLQTWANVPIIINHGAAWYSDIGTESSSGTRVFSISGKVKNTGMVEVPMGMTLREVVFDICGGIIGDKKFKAIEVGGPMGGFVPESLLDLQVDYEELDKVGLAMGPSLIVLDEDTCIVDMVKYFLNFLAKESCGKCTPCRDGLRHMINILNRISEGRGRKEDLDLLELIAKVQKKAALCALGQGASDPLLSTLKHFRDEYEAHIEEKSCPGCICKALSAASSGANA